MQKPQREPHVRAPSSRTDRSATDAACSWTHQQQKKQYLQHWLEETVFNIMESVSMFKVFVHREMSDKDKGSCNAKWNKELLSVMVEYVSRLIVSFFNNNNNMLTVLCAKCLCQHAWALCNTFSRRHIYQLTWWHLVIGTEDSAAKADGNVSSLMWTVHCFTWWTCNEKSEERSFIQQFNPSGKMMYVGCIFIFLFSPKHGLDNMSHDASLNLICKCEKHNNSVISNIIRRILS